MIKKFLMTSALSAGLITGFASTQANAATSSHHRKVAKSSYRSSFRHHYLQDSVNHGNRLTMVSSLGHRYRHHRGAHVIQCVGYVHMASDFQIHGNARDWWKRAEGKYDRGSVPQAKAVLAFKPVRRMRLGHVAIVHRVIDNRTITIDQAHWGENRITKDVKVIDVSQKNNWSVVRVELAHAHGKFGSLYPTYGFIYHDKLDGNSDIPPVGGAPESWENSEKPESHNLDNSMASVPDDVFSHSDTNPNSLM